MTPALIVLALGLQEKPKQDVQVSGHAGFGGVVERGEWTPLTIDLDNRGAEDLDLVLAVVWGQSAGVQDTDAPTLGSLYGKTGPVHRLPVPIAARSRKRLSLSLRAPRGERLNPWVFAESARTGRALASGELLARSLPPRQRLVVVVGGDRLEGFPGFRAQAAPEHLPEDWRAYASVDTLVWLDARASDLRSQAQADALRAWLEFGGRLIVARSAEIGLAGTPLAELLPVTMNGSRPVDSLSALSTVAGPAPPGRALLLDVAPARGRVRLQQDGRPLVVQGERGAGTSIFVAFDPSTEPFASWAGGTRFWAWAAPLRPAPEAAPSGPTPPESIGAMSLAMSAGVFPDVAPPEIGGLFVLIAVYLVVVGPFDYFVLRKLRKLELTWITFPAYVTVFTLLILFAGGAFIERAAYQREIVVVDRGGDLPTERRRALSAVLAPRNQRYAVDGAEPVSRDYRPSRLDALDVGTSSLLRAPEIRLRDWTVARGATGLVVSDRLAPARGRISWTIRGDRLAVRNDSGAAARPAALIARDLVYEVDPLPVGSSEVRLKARGTIAEYLRAEKAQAVQDGAPAHYDAPGTAPSVSEAALDARLRRSLLSLSFGPEGPASTGFARSLGVGRWLEGGGSVLLVWEKPEAAETAFEPRPTLYSGLAMIRYFQGPTK